MKQNWPKVLREFTLPYEGGKVNNPKDPGGRTNQGVTQRVYDADRRQHRLPVRSVYEMTDQERDDIYLDEYWRPVNGDTLASGVDAVVFDAGVMSGVSRAKTWLNKSVGGDAVDTVKRVCRARLGFVQGLKSLFKTFGKGWTRRIAACEAYGVALALKDMHPSDLAERTPKDHPAETTQGAVVVGVLLDEANEAKDDAAKDMTKGAATTGLAAGGGGTATASPDSIPLNGWLIAGFVVGLTLAAAYYFWRVHVNRLRADAMTTEAGNEAMKG